MIKQKQTFRFILFLMFLNFTSQLIFCQQTWNGDETTLTVNQRQAGEWGNARFDKITIVRSPGITWLRITEGAPAGNRSWESSYNVLYDGVPIEGSTMICPKRPLPEVGPKSWRLVEKVYIYAWGQGSVTLRRIPLAPDPPYGAEGEYIEKDALIDGIAQMDGRIEFNPVYIQPGNTINIKVTIPQRMRRHITGVVLTLPVPPNSNQNTVTLPFELDGVYNFQWTVPVDPFYDGFNVPGDLSVKFEAYSNKPDENNRSYLVTSGTGYINVASVLRIEMILQHKIVQSGSTNTWDNERPRTVSANFIKGRQPFKFRWIVNQQEVKTLPYSDPNTRGSTLEDQNVLKNANEIICEVTDANGNRASGTIFVGVASDISLQFNVQGVKVENGATVNWTKDKSKLVTINPINGGKFPLKGRWLVNDAEVVSKTLVNRFDQIEDQKILGSAQKITYEVTDANGIVFSASISIGNPGPDIVQQPTSPVGPAPTPPPLTGDPNRKPNPEVDWNNKPWLNDKVQQCTREYLERIVLFMENEIRKWENSGLPESKQNPLFTSIDDWGRLLNQYISASGGVDGSWDNPTHYVWSVYNKQSAGVRYGRTVEYYVKYECNLLNYSADDLNSAIKDLTESSQNSKWSDQKVKETWNNLNSLLNICRTLYSQFNTNYYKFLKEANNQSNNLLVNDIVALCLASAQNQFTNHTVNKDTIDLSGNALIVQSAANKNIDMLEIVRILSEVQGQSDDMNRKMGEMHNLLSARGGDIDEILTNGQHLVAQGNVNPSFAQDGGVNVEFFGDGLDNFGDGLQDFLYGNIRRGNVLIIVWDSGGIADDIFEVSLSDRGSLGTTPPGARRNFDLNLGHGTYKITVKGIYTNPNTPPCTFGIQVFDGDSKILQDGANPEVGQESSFTITIK